MPPDAPLFGVFIAGPGIVGWLLMTELTAEIDDRGGMTGRRFAREMLFTDSPEAHREATAIQRERPYHFVRAGRFLDGDEQGRYASHPDGCT